MKQPHFLYGKIITQAKNGTDMRKLLKDLDELRHGEGCSMETKIKDELNMEVELRVRCEDITRICNVVIGLYKVCQGDNKKLDIHINSEGENWDDPKLR